MDEVVTSIRRVTDLMGKISSASSEQSAGVAQVGEAVQQMDQVTQQNAALVEEMAAAASSLKAQSGALVQTVAVFNLGADESMVRTRVRSSANRRMIEKGGERRSTAAAPGSAPIPKMTFAATRVRLAKSADVAEVSVATAW
jgi:methyl-accepting chemotaxis protein